MNVATVSIDRDEARAKLREYRAALHKKADAEYERTAELYRHAAMGRRLMNVRDAILNAPTDAMGRPRLAIALANATECRVSRWHREITFTGDAAGWGRRGRRRGGSVITLAGVPPATIQHAQGFAMVPMVPPAIRGNRNLAHCFILWEVETWHDRSRMQPDRDPYLLQHIGGDIYAVIGEWDLTDIERLAMSARNPA